MRFRTRHRRRIWCTLLGTACLLVALPAAANARINVTVGGYDVPTGPDPVNGLLVLAENGGGDAVVTFVQNAPDDESDDQIVVVSSQDINESTPACSHPESDPTRVVCELSMVSDQAWVIAGGDGDDQLTLAGVAPPDTTNIFIIGGCGSDALTGGPAPERFYGDDTTGGSSCSGGNHDTISDGLGRDFINGEDGNDTVLQSPLGSASPDQDEDNINLGDGSADTVSYAAREASKAVTIRMPATDGFDDSPGETLDASGTPGEEDDIDSGTERAIGTAGNDRFETGSSTYPQVLDGGAGNDVFIAGPMDEQFIGGAGTDTVRWDSASSAFTSIVATPDGVANDGNDPGSAPDNVGADIEVLIGTSGPDQITGAAVAGCRVVGGAGNDVLRAPGSGCVLEGGDGADAIIGGAGNDIVRPGASGTAVSDQITFGGGYDTIDYATASMIAGASGISGVQASAAPGAAVWCYGLGVGTTSAYKYVAGQPHRDRYVDAPERMVGTVVADTFCGGGAGTQMEGGDGNDVLVGGAGNDILYGQGDNDLLNGQAGSDQLYGGDGDDNLNGGAGPDIVDGGPGNDPHVRGGGGSDTILGGPGNDVLDEIPYSTIMQGVPGDELDGPDVLDGGPGIDQIDGSGGDDVMACNGETLQDSWSDTGGGVEVLDCRALPYGISITTGPGIDHIIGTSHGDTLAGAPNIDGGPGNDNLYAAAGGSVDGGPGNDVLHGTAAGDTLVGGDGDDVLDGGDGNDTLVGGNGNDALAGGGGDDALDGGAGGDSLNGGPGTETLSYADRGGSVVVSVGGGADDGQPGEGDDVRDDIEVLIGTRFNDRLAAGSVGMHLQGGDGNDVLVGSPKNDQLDGGNGNDRLAGGAGGNVLHGGPGNDFLLGGRQSDQLWGDEGNDTLDGGFGKDLFVGGSGIDTASYKTRRKPVNVGIAIGKWNDGEKRERDHIGKDVENLIGGRGNDRLVGSDRNNVIRGGVGGGRDVIDGGKGNDRLYGGSGNDRITGGPGNDRMYGERGNDQIFAGDASRRDKRFREIVHGGPGKDRVQADPRDRTIQVESRRRSVHHRKVKRRVKR